MTPQVEREMKMCMNASHTVNRCRRLDYKFTNTFHVVPCVILRFWIVYHHCCLAITSILFKFSMTSSAVITYQGSENV